MRIGGLFSGIGGLEFGLESVLPARTLWQVEIDPFCRQVLEKHWPGAQRYDDIRGLTGLPRVDILCGGFPCQDLSQANKGGAGLDGDKSGLWYEMLRVIREIRPSFVVIENVRGLIGRALDEVVSGLYRAGYDVEGTRIEAGSLGAPHHRERVLLVAAYTHRKSQPVVRLDEEAPGMCPPARRLPAWAVGVRVDDGLPGRMDAARMRALGNAVAPRVGAVAGMRIRGLIS